MEILQNLKSERGYLLSYHFVLNQLDPLLLEAYGGLYRTCTLRERFLSARTRELIWVALLTELREKVGDIHIERAKVCGVTESELSAALKLASISAAWDALEFAGSWSGTLADDEVIKQYRSIVSFAGDGLNQSEQELLMLTVQGARRTRTPFIMHLRSALELGVSEAEIAEALSYLLMPAGANALLWTTDQWLDAVRQGELPESATFGKATFEWKSGS